MLQNFIDWFVVGLRWAHIVALLGWVGASLYFMWLDSKLRPPGVPRENVLGEAWMGHGGGFYIVEKRHIAPGKVPSPLYWFRNEAAITWVTGFLLLVFVYYWGGGVDLVDADRARIGPGAAIAFAIALLAVCWFAYDTLWSTQFSLDRPGATTAISLLLLFGVVLLLCALFNGRAAYIHVGAVMGTCMVGSVWRRIIPAQEEAVAATSAGRERNMAMAQRARRRAQHNTYLTLPVIFTMIAAHAPSTYSHALNWLIMALVILVGIAARHMMILFDRRVTKATPWFTTAAPLLAASVVLAVLTMPQVAPSSAPTQVSFNVARGIVELRCASCHAQKPVNALFAAAPAGVRLDSAAEIAKNAPKIQLTAVSTRSMPPGNATRMTQEERTLLANWIRLGAPTDGASSP